MFKGLRVSTRTIRTLAISAAASIVDILRQVPENGPSGCEYFWAEIATQRTWQRSRNRKGMVRRQTAIFAPGAILRQGKQDDDASSDDYRFVVFAKGASEGVGDFSHCGVGFDCGED